MWSWSSWGGGRGVLKGLPNLYWKLYTLTNHYKWLIMAQFWPICYCPWDQGPAVSGVSTRTEPPAQLWCEKKIYFFCIPKLVRLKGKPWWVVCLPPSLLGSSPGPCREWPRHPGAPGQLLHCTVLYCALYSKLHWSKPLSAWRKAYIPNVDFLAQTEVFCWTILRPKECKKTPKMHLKCLKRKILLPK